jgi:hypothetical protein
LFAQQRAGTEIRVNGGWNLNTSLLVNYPWASERFYFELFSKMSKIRLSSTALENCQKVAHSICLKREILMELLEFIKNIYGEVTNNTSLATFKSKDSPVRSFLNVIAKIMSEPLVISQ